jgi:hypothetical protein
MRIWPDGWVMANPSRILKSTYTYQVKPVPPVRAVRGRRLSPTARSCITFENEEITHGLDRCLELADIVPTVLDIHHHWIKTGEYISPTDDRVARVVDSWRGVRPAMHYSVSREDVLVDHAVHHRPDHASLLESGYKKAKAAEHIRTFTGIPVVTDWALEFLGPSSTYSAKAKARTWPVSKCTIVR